MNEFGEFLINHFWVIIIILTLLVDRKLRAFALALLIVQVAYGTGIVPKWIIITITVIGLMKSISDNWSTFSEKKNP